MQVLLSRISRPRRRVLSFFQFFSLWILTAGAASLGAQDANSFPIISLTAGKPALNGRVFLSRIRKGGHSSWSDIARLPRSAWKPLASAAFSEGYSPDTFILRLALRNTGEASIWYVRIPNNRLDYADFRLETSRGVVEHRAGDHRPRTGSEATAYPVFRFRLPPGESGVLLIRLKSTALMTLHLTVESPETFGGTVHQERLFEIAMTAILLLLILVQYLLHRRRETAMQIYFALAMVFGGLWMWVRFGAGPLHLYPHSVFWKDNGVFILLVPVMVALNLFIREFLNIRIVSRPMDRLLLYSGLFPLATMPFYFLELEIWIKNLIVNAGLPLHGAFVVAAFIVSLRARRWWIIHVFFAWFCFVIAVVFQYVVIFSDLPYSVTAVNALLLLVPTWLVIGMGAMVWRVWALKRERDEILARMMDLIRDESEVPPQDKDDSTKPPPTPLPSRIASEKRVKTLDTETLLDGLMRLVKEERLYLREELSLEDFAARLGIRPDQLSALLNLKLGISFSRLINRHRIDEACRRLLEHPEQTALRIALDCGFGSRTAFNREFKRHTGMSPAEYRRADSPAVKRPDTPTDGKSRS